MANWQNMQLFLYISKAFAEENRIRILNMLREQELCVCQIIEVLNLAPSTVSKHLSILEQAQLIESEKRGRWVYYQLAKKPLRVIQGSYKLIFDSIREDKQIKRDLQKLKKVLNTDLEKLPVQKNKSFIPLYG